MFLVDLDVPGSVLPSLGFSGHRWDIRSNSSSRCEGKNEALSSETELTSPGGEMTANRNAVRERFEVPGFVSENRPEFEKVSLGLKPLGAATLFWRGICTINRISVCSNKRP